MEGADGGADEAGHQAADVEGLTEVAGDGADVGSGAAVDVDFEVVAFAVKELDARDLDFARGELDGLAGAGEVVSAFSVDVQSGELRGRLLDAAEELFQFGFDVAAIEVARSGCFDDVACGVIGVAAPAEAEAGAVGLGEILNPGDEARGWADAEDEDAGCHRVEGSGMSDLGFAGEEALDFVDDVTGGDARGFVDVEEAEHRAVEWRERRAAGF